MSSFLFALLGAFLCGIGARDQILVARLAAHGRSAARLLTIGVPIAVLTAAFMAWAGHAVSAQLPAAAKTMLVAIALLLAAFELAWPNRTMSPKEPTRSLGALAVVLAARQLSDASRFLIFAFAAATGVPMLAGIGGAAGGAGTLILAALAGSEMVARWPLRKYRLILSAVLGVTAIVIGLSARGLV